MLEEGEVWEDRGRDREEDLREILIIVLRRNAQERNEWAIIVRHVLALHGL